MKTKEQLLAEIDATLDQLIRHTEVLRTVSAKSLMEHEVLAVQKTQQSLLAHLIRTEDRLSQAPAKAERSKRIETTTALPTIQEKIHTYFRLNSEIASSLQNKEKAPSPQEEADKKKRLVQKPRIGRNRKPSKA